jgi:hypothetical protein
MAAFSIVEKKRESKREDPGWAKETDLFHDNPNPNLAMAAFSIVEKKRESKREDPGWAKETDLFHEY